VDKYRIYIDEVGNPDLESSDNPNHRFLSLTGVILGLDYVASVVQPKMEALKAKYFPHHPDEPVVFHRTEMLNALPPFQVLRDHVVRERSDDDLLGLMSEWDYTVISVCIDKKKHKDSYAVWRYDPYHYCLMILLERYVFFLKRAQSHGDAMAESRGGNEDRRLKAAFLRLWKQGTDYVGPDQFQAALTSNSRLKPSRIILPDSNSPTCSLTQAETRFSTGTGCCQGRLLRSQTASSGF
jgi:hypothetical protein